MAAWNKNLVDALTECVDELRARGVPKREACRRVISEMEWHGDTPTPQALEQAMRRNERGLYAAGDSDTIDGKIGIAESCRRIRRELDKIEESIK